MIGPSALLPQGCYGLKLPSIIQNPCFVECFCVHQVEPVLARPKWISIGTARIWDISFIKYCPITKIRKTCYHLASFAYELSIFSASCSDDSTQKGDKDTTFPIIIRVGETRSADLTSSTRSFNKENTYSVRNIQDGRVRLNTI
jgi:hypothetical protein